MIGVDQDRTRLPMKPIVAALIILTTGAGAAEPIDIGSRRELFVDNHLVERLAGKAELRLHHPTPREITLVHDAPWEGNATAFHSVFRDSHPNASSDARYKTFLISQKPPRKRPYKCADGIHWSPMRDEPTITHGAFDSHNLSFWDAVRGEYRAYWRYFTKGTTNADAWEPAGIRSIRTATSPDLVHWKQEADLAYVGSPPEQLYENGVAPYHRASHLLIGFPVRYVGRAGIECPGTWNYGQNVIACHMVETSSHLAGAPNELSRYATE